MRRFFLGIEGRPMVRGEEGPGNKRVTSELKVCGGLVNCHRKSVYNKEVPQCNNNCSDSCQNII